VIVSIIAAQQRSAIMPASHQQHKHGLSGTAVQLVASATPLVCWHTPTSPVIMSHGAVPVSSQR
jgi:hypothetical protein